MKNYRIYYKTIGVTTASTPVTIITAADADEAVAIFQARRPWSCVVAIFAE